MEDDELSLKHIFPIGEERWIKVKFYDLDKSIKAFRMVMYGLPYIEHGYEVTAIGLKDEYVPQITALLDVKDDIINTLHGRIGEHELNVIKNLMNYKINELRERVIKNTDAESKESI